MDKLSSFVSEQLKSGVSPAELKAHLLGNGWKESDVSTAIKNAEHSHTKNRLFIGLLGVVLVGLLAWILISYADTPKDIPPPAIVNPDASLQTNNPASTCIITEYSVEKNECYKTLLKSGYDCEKLEDNIEYTYCTRAYEETLIVIEVADKVEEN